MTDTPTIDGWVIIELMGHRRLAGRVTEVQVAGEGFLRLDVPGPGQDDPPAATQFYRPGVVYCLTPTSERLARAFAQRSQPAPVQRWELPPASETAEPAGDVWGGDGDD